MTRRTVSAHVPQLTAIDELRPHPLNYRSHPEEQVRHIAHSIREHGFYRNVVVARDGTILAGHGVVEAARREGMGELPVVRLDVDANDPKALKVLTADNELARFAGVDDRQLTELLKTIGEVDVDGLLGTGYSTEQLAALAYVTRPSSEIGDVQDAALWAGMPEFDSGEKPFQLVISCDSEADREQLMAKLGANAVQQRHGKVWSIWWPLRDRDDPSALRFEATS